MGVRFKKIRFYSPQRSQRTKEFASFIQSKNIDWIKRLIPKGGAEAALCKVFMPITNTCNPYRVFMVLICRYLRANQKEDKRSVTSVVSNKTKQMPVTIFI